MKTQPFTAPAFDYTGWQHRWQAVKTTLDHMLTIMEQNEKSPRQETLYSVLTALKAFGESQVNFFLEGFGPNPRILLEPSVQYPPEYALRITIDQIVHDMGVIVRSWEQRWSRLAPPEMRTMLNKADILANQALEPAIREGLIKGATVVTYFQKATHVRIIPYAPVAFISLPLTALTSPQDLLAIPHEVGHYVYRHGRVRTGKLKGSRFEAALTQRLVDQTPWGQTWLEEIFADVYGGLVGGPVMALGFEDLVTANRRDELTHDDGEHPVAALRPATYHTIFKAMGGFERVTAALVERWQARLQECGNPTHFRTSDGVVVSLAEAQSKIDAIVMDLFNSELAGVQAHKLWSKELAKDEPVETLCTRFVQSVKELTSDVTAHVPELQSSEQTDDERWMRLMTAHEKKAEEYQVGTTGLWIDAIKAAAQQKQSFNMPPQVWMALLDGSGWATEGPGANSH